MEAEVENKYAAFGKALEPFDEDDVPKKKPVRPEDQIATDEKGRRRFHGAFTGGFSAGYFNSVGTEQGWAPSTFKSSRSQRNDTSVFGIAPRTIHTTKLFTAPEHKKNKRKRTNAQKEQSAFLFDDKRFKDLIVPLNNSIGVKLLYKMGWKHGQGIGPKVKKLVKKPDVEAPQSNVEAPQSNVKTYGCSLPPTVGNDSDDEFENFTFAPKDVEIVQYVPKENLQGLGYLGLDKRPVLASNFSLLANSSSTPATKRQVGIRGQAFGVGAFEKDDDDIYLIEDMSNYNFEETPALKELTKKKIMVIAKILKHVTKILEGFQLATKQPPTKKHFPLPNLPANFKPFHQIKNVASVEAKNGSDNRNISSTDRSLLLAEEIPGGSVFNFIAPHDRARLDSIRELIQKESKVKKADSSENLITEEVLLKITSVKKEPEVIPEPAPQPIQAGEFKPFATDGDKQKRYERYLASGSTDTNKKLLKLTEWEKVRENEEFQKASQLYRPLAAGIASRFVSANSLELDDEAPKPLPPVILDANKTDLVKAVEMKMFGRLTREKVAWYPDKLLCRRFNVPNPYPDSTMVGVEKQKKERFSIFNFLTAGTLETASKEQQEREIVKEVPIDKTPIEDAEQEINTGETLEEKTEKEEAKEEERPSMDLFKAIFQDSSEDSASETEDNNEISQIETNEPEIAPQPETNNPVAESTNSKFLEREVAIATARTRSRWGPTSETSFADTSVESEVQEMDIAYGPKLPPPIAEIVALPPVLSSEEKKKHKHDKHTRKHKKHKKQKKKRKHSYSLSSDNETNTADVEEINAKEILLRLKSIKKSAHNLL
uniref:G-patch domain-containing protein n=1 Tax=Strigamia maritima TaxID=126957 RepID=T1ISB5_STRMM